MEGKGVENYTLYQQKPTILNLMESDSIQGLSLMVIIMEREGFESSVTNNKTMLNQVRAFQCGKLVKPLGMSD